jgi:hypothetical protein
VFWFIVSLAYVAYINVTCRDPGYVTHYTSDTEQNFAQNSSFSKEIAMNSSVVEEKAFAGKMGALRQKRPHIRLDS